MVRDTLCICWSFACWGHTRGLLLHLSPFIYPQPRELHIHTCQYTHYTHIRTVIHTHACMHARAHTTHTDTHKHTSLSPSHTFPPQSHITRGTNLPMAYTHTVTHHEGHLLANGHFLQGAEPGCVMWVSMSVGRAVSHAHVCMFSRAGVQHSITV